MWKRIAFSVVSLALSASLCAASLEEVVSKELVGVGVCTSSDGSVRAPCERYKDGEDSFLLIYGEYRGEFVPALAIQERTKEVVWKNPVFFPEV